MHVSEIWGQHYGVTASFMFFDRGTFWVSPLYYFYLPKSARAYLFLQSVNIHYFCSGPISVDPTGPQPTVCHVLAEETGDISLTQPRFAAVLDGRLYVAHFTSQARHGTAGHGTARHGMAQHDSSPYGGARRPSKHRWVGVRGFAAERDFTG